MTASTRRSTGPRFPDVLGDELPAPRFLTVRFTIRAVRLEQIDVDRFGLVYVYLSGTWDLGMGVGDRWRKTIDLSASTQSQTHQSRTTVPSNRVTGYFRLFACSRAASWSGRTQASSRTLPAAT